MKKIIYRNLRFSVLLLLALSIATLDLFGQDTTGTGQQNGARNTGTASTNPPANSNAPANGGGGANIGAGADQSAINSKLSALLNFNFAGNNNTWTNTTPIIFYGWSLPGTVNIGHRNTKGSASVKTNGSKEDKGNKTTPLLSFSNLLQVGPYVGTTIGIKDSTSYLPAIMLPGNAGVEFNDYLTFGDDSKFSVTVAPLNLGIKFISGFTDTTLSLVQDNIRQFVGIKFQDKFSLSGQFTTGWHNASSSSEANFTKVFRRTDSKVQYWNLNFTCQVLDNLLNSGSTSSPLYLSLSLRGLVRPKDNFNLPNYRFFTIGISTDLNFKSGSSETGIPKDKDAPAPRVSRKMPTPTTLQ